MNHKNQPPVRLGRMARWHKNTTYAILLSCAVTGVAWFVLGEIFDFLPPQLRFWWITHGLCGLLTFLSLALRSRNTYWSLGVHTETGWPARFRP